MLAVEAVAASASGDGAEMPAATSVVVDVPADRSPGLTAGRAQRKAHTSRRPVTAQEAS